MRKAFLALFLGTAMAASAWTVAAQSTAITVVAPGIVTVKAEGVPLGDLLKQLSTLVAMDRLKIAPAALSVPVTVEAEQVPVAEAMFLVLKASNVDYVMSGTRLLAGGAGEAKPGQGAAAEPPRETAANVAIIGAEPGRGNDGSRQAAAAGGVAPGSMAETETAPAAVSDETADQFGFLVGAEVIEFKMVEDSAVITTPGFVPYKLRPDVVARRKGADLAKIP
jgi:hypothetical protein